MPLWAQVLDDLRARLAGGEFADRFPTDGALVERYGVSRQTVREAVRRLSDEGLLERTRGRGTTVRGFEHVGGSLESLYEQIEAQGAAQRSVVQARERVVDGPVAQRLGLAPDARLVYIERLRLADEEPLALDRAWLPARVAASLMKADLSHTGIYVELLRAAGLQVDGGSEQIRPVIPAAEDRRTLRLPRGEAAFSIARLTRSGGRPVEWRTSIVRGDRYTISLELARSARVPWVPAEVA
ncbi:GntR family transcriptional regulator [Paraconexibacter antarcticus]|uniref:GntR family transcriptional regulator n=1 Tax=Paraconexibacter antarcticus TaxID=2949664 RepID=A0ABY5DUS4_9ACTN|nr:GntR family transcriptional regulator [Paraconexibacter antarcticus]UTI65329.1 GntR family transcriptional regulator [Paraconexibacter antarcticus]